MPILHCLVRLVPQYTVSSSSFFAVDGTVSGRLAWYLVLSGGGGELEIMVSESVYLKQNKTYIEQTDNL